ncbi:DUF6297 family protein [Kocuria sp.]|uniref:DUF6297 family protein n=1 Tax=Kocuria sp. TaxID=1871328 RepID=UPI0026E11100|nr:DUF6297 family protein [Kocuria sp.]MDO5618503.1 DUF6297 family protein [Kocuria sp.]
MNAEHQEGQDASEFDPWLHAHDLTRRRNVPPWTHRLEDLYTQIFAFLVATAIAASVVHFSEAAFSGVAHVFLPVWDTNLGLPPWAALFLYAVAGLCLAIWTVLSTGPMWATRPELVWGFQLPVDRAPFLRRRLVAVIRRSGMLSMVSAAALTVMIWAGAASPWAWMGWVLAVAFSGPVIASLAVRAQCRQTAETAPRTAGTFAYTSCLLWTPVTVLTVGLLSIAVWQWMPTPLPALGSWSVGVWSGVVALVVGLVVTAATLRWAARGIHVLGWPALERAGGRAQVAQAARMSLDIQEMYRSVLGPGQAGRGGWMLPHASDWPRAPHWLHVSNWPTAALARAETVAWLRMSGPLPLWAASAAAALLFLAVPQWSAPVLVVTALIALLLAAADLAASSARTSALNPHVESVIPVSATAARMVRTAVPCTIMAVWGAAVFGALSLLFSAPLLMLMGVLAAVGVGATATAGARRPPVDWAGATIMTDAGPLPIGVGSQIAGAHLAGLVAVVPTGVAVALGNAFPDAQWLLLGIQAAQTAVAMGWSLHQQRRTT